MPPRVCTRQARAAAGPGGAGAVGGAHAGWRGLVAGVVQRSVDVVEAADAAERVLLAAHSGPLMQTIRRELDARNVPAACGAAGPDVLALLRAALDGKPPPPGPMARQSPTEFGERPLGTREFVAHAHLHGLHVHLWTVHEPTEMDRLLDLGVDGIITDLPAVLAGRIAARN